MDSEGDKGTFSLEGATGFLRRRSLAIFGTLFVFFILGQIYCVVATRYYTASAAVFIDPRMVDPFQKDSNPGGFDSETPLLNSQLEIIKSERVASSVIEKLDLEKDPEFASPSLSLIGNLLQLYTGVFNRRSEDSKYILKREVVRTFESRLKVKRQTLTYVFEIAFDSINPAKAAKIANAIANAYIHDQLEARKETNKIGNLWLQERLTELRDEALRTDHAVQLFKRENGIVNTGHGLINEQQLVEKNTQLSLATQNVAESKTRLDRIMEVIQTGAGAGMGNISDALKNDVITRLRLQYVDVAKREAEISAKYGANHIAAVNARNEMREIERNIFDQLRQIADSYKSDYEIAVNRQKAVQNEIDKLVRQAASMDELSVQLRQLESAAQASRALYDNFLQKFIESTQRQSYPIPDARVITAATPPLSPSWPRKILIIPGSILSGLILGMAVGLFREKMDGVFRTSAQVEAVLAVEMLGVLPQLRQSDLLAQDPNDNNKSPGSHDIVLPDCGSLNYAVKNPFSLFARTLRNAKVVADIKARDGAKKGKTDCKIIGIVSALPSEGKTLIASNLAHLIANAGEKCVLIDGDLHNPTLSRFLAADAKAGLVEVASGTATMEDVLRQEPSTGLLLIPAVVSSRISNTNEILVSDGMRSGLEGLRRNFSYIIVDLPPLVPIVDAKASAHLFDGFILVIEWGKTNRKIVSETLKGASAVYEKLIGCFLNKVEVSAMRKFEHHHDDHYRHLYYEEYGQVKGQNDDKNGSLGTEEKK